MDFNLTQEQKMVQQRAREFAEKEIEPIAAQIDEESRIPDDMTEKLGKAAAGSNKSARDHNGNRRRLAGPLRRRLI